ncbi:MAG: hypothetical protein Q4D89_06090 [Arachnia propionica]|uniref:hypothetical protein n=1 Tax=Arachnia propionica TaxID=1750 RepID=UPI0026F77FF6|nr:hypothetical protein [Arachnia propionica]
MTRTPDLLALLHSYQDAINATPASALLEQTQSLLADANTVTDGLLLAGELPTEELKQLAPTLVNLSCQEEHHELTFSLLARLPFDAGAEIIVPEVFRLLRKPSSDYWTVWMLARLLHHLGYHNALRHIVTATEETPDEDWRMAGRWIASDLLANNSSESAETPWTTTEQDCTIE